MDKSRSERDVNRSAGSVAVRAGAAVVALLLCLVGAPAFAQSTSVTWLMQGVVDPGSYLFTRRGGATSLDGQTFSACAKFDPASAPNQSGDGTTYRSETSVTKPFIRTHRAEGAGLALQAGQHVAPVNEAQMSLREVGAVRFLAIFYGRGYRPPPDK